MHSWCLVMAVGADFKVSLGTRQSVRKRCKAFNSNPLVVAGRPHVHLRALSASSDARGGSQSV